MGLQVPVEVGGAALVSTRTLLHWGARLSFALQQLGYYTRARFNCTEVSCRVALLTLRTLEFTSEILSPEESLPFHSAL